MNKQLPSATKIEQQIISACLLFPENVDQAVSLLKPADFYDGWHRKVFAEIKSLHEQGREVDEAVLEDRLDKEVYFDTTQASTSIEDDARDIKKYSDLRNIIKICRQVENGAYNKDDPNDLRSKLNEIFEHSSGNDITSLAEALTDAVERNLEVVNGERTLGIKPGLDVDDTIGGYEDGKVYVIAARPAMGKSAYALHIMKGIAEQGVPVGMLSLEMGKLSLANRILINAMGIDGKKLRQEGGLSEREKEIMFEAASEIGDLPIYFDDSPVINEGSLRAKANIMKRRYDIGALVIDYLQLMSGSGNNRREIVDGISRTTKLVAKDLNIPVIPLSQLSRAVEQRDPKRPQLSDLRESGAIEQDADCVQFLYRPSEYGKEYYPDSDIFDGPTENICEVIVAKNRSGETGIKQQLFIPSKMQFKNLESKYNDVF